LKDDYQYDPGAYDYGGDDDWADEDASWGEDGTQSAEAPQPGQEAEPATEGRDESSAYLDFLNEEVSREKKAKEVTCGWQQRGNSEPRDTLTALVLLQVQKFRGADEIDSDDDLGEESLILDSPLDKIDAYQLFAATIHSMFYPIIMIGS